MYHSFKAQWLLYVPPPLKRSGFCMYHRLESAVVAVCTTSFKAKWLLCIPPRLKAQWLIYIPPRVTFGSLIHVSPAQYRRYLFRILMIHAIHECSNTLTPLVRVTNVFAVRRGLTFTLPSWVRRKEIDVWDRHVACVHIFVPPLEQSNQWTDWFSRNLVWTLSRWKSPTPRTFWVLYK